MNKRAIIYTRFSPRRDAEKCESCETQLAYCEQLAAKKKLSVGGVYHDKDVSGADEYREKLWQAIEALHKGDVLVVYKRDRLARNVYLSEQINRAVEKHGGSIEAVSGDVEGNGPEHTMIRQVLASIAEYERKMIGQRTRHFMRMHQANGRLMSRYAPYGWTLAADGAKMQPNERELAAITRICTLRAAGESFGEIVKTLQAEMPDAARAGKWNTKTVWKIVRRQE